MQGKSNYASEITGSEVPAVPAGRYLARLDGVENATTRFGEALKWHWFVVDPEDGSDFEITQITSTATSGGSNAGRIIRALIGRALAAGEKLSTAELAGKFATLDVSIHPDSGWNRVEEVFPAPRPPQSNGAAAPEPVGSVTADPDFIEWKRQKLAERQAAARLANEENDPSRNAPPPTEAPAGVEA